MTIEISTKKVVSTQTGKAYQIESIEGVLGAEDLPEEYMKGTPRAYMRAPIVYEDGSTLPPHIHVIYKDFRGTHSGFITAGDIIPADSFERKMTAVSQAAARLHDIKRKLEYQDSRTWHAWNGEETFTI